MLQPWHTSISSGAPLFYVKIVTVSVKILSILEKATAEDGKLNTYTR